MPLGWEFLACTASRHGLALLNESEHMGVNRAYFSNQYPDAPVSFCGGERLGDIAGPLTFLLTHLMCNIDVLQILESSGVAVMHGLSSFGVLCR